MTTPPKIADAAMIGFLGSAEWVDIGCGPGQVHLYSAQQWVRSEPITFANRVEIVLVGRYDALLVEECGTLTLTDNKTSTKTDAHLRVYQRQLAAYAYALEHPARGSPLQVDEIALWVLSRSHFIARPKRMGLYGPTRWISFARRDNAFLRLLEGAAQILDAPEPYSSARCAWCVYQTGDGARRV